MNRAGGDRRVGQTIKASRELATRRVGGRGWLNGRELGGADPRYLQLEASDDSAGRLSREGNGKRRAPNFLGASVKRGVRAG